MGSYAIVGAHLPIALGRRGRPSTAKSGQVAVCFFGDGTTNIGAFHEALNMAAVWKAPVVFVCENNQYMEYTPIGAVTAVARPAADRASAYGLEPIVVDGNDVEAVLRGGRATAIDRARAGDGPSLIEALTYRHGGHSRADPGKYRPDDEVAAWKARDPIPAQRARLIAAGVAEADARRDRRRDADEGRRRGGDARAAPEPVAGRDRDPGLDRRGLGMAELTYRAGGGRLGIAQEMERDPSVVLIGEDVGAAGGVFKLTEGLFDQFGPDRVRDTPISEQAIVGAAMGAAMTGLRPIAELMFSDFFAVAWDMVANQIAKTRYMTDGQVSLPLVLRTANGAGLRFGAQHSQSVENWAMAIPGLKVVAPSTPADVVGLMAAAIRDPDPVIFCEHKALFAIKGDVPDGEHLVPLGQAAVVREGDRLHDRRARGDGSAGGRGRGAAPGRARNLRRGDRPPDARPARHHRRSSPRSRRRAGSSRSRRTRGCAAGAPRSSRSSQTTGFYSLDAPARPDHDAARPAAVGGGARGRGDPDRRSDRGHRPRRGWRPRK